jgi:hypothetical protein
MKMKTKGSTTEHHLRQETHSGSPLFAVATAPSSLSSAKVNGIIVTYQNDGGDKYKYGDQEGRDLVVFV